MRKRIKDDFDKYLEEQLKDEEFKKAYEELEPLYALIKEEIRIRTEKGITQEELAKRMNTTQSAIARFEAGNVNPSLKFIQRLSKALGGKLRVSIKT
jgi:ribosome-binding protein aMBF1 (putative translation factor)